ncbi:MAG: aminopeptidase [Armatimonadetes bacterium]|nr:aminopeptidase [Armatimonadota bacterium]
MPDPRLSQLAHTLVSHSLRLRAGERVLIEAFDTPDDFLQVLLKTVADAGGVPFIETRSNRVLRALYQNASEAQMTAIGEHELRRMETMDAYIGIRGAENSLELSDVPAEKLALYQNLWWRPVADRRVNQTKWVVLRYPTPAFAQSAGMSTEAFTDFYFDVCTLDYGKMQKAMEPLQERMRKADQVHLTGERLDLRFSIKDIGAIMCYGERNIPDGECFSCPIRDSVNGHIQFNTTSLYQGSLFEGIRFVLENGKIIEASAASPAQTERLNQILDSDEGARYIGEFSLGFNPYVLQPMRDTLFDEKIAGSFHFTPGQAYAIADNGNRSQVHWDLVYIQRPEYGGGEIRFDGELIRKDGLFVPEDLQGLNPERLK